LHVFTPGLEGRLANRSISQKRTTVKKLLLIGIGVVLSLAGGLIGLTLGLAALFVMAGLIGWPLVLSPLAMLAACGVSAAVGAFFGYYTRVEGVVSRTDRGAAPRVSLAASRRRALAYGWRLSKLLNNHG
jgi:hypothetical protein